MKDTKEFHEMPPICPDQLDQRLGQQVTRLSGTRVGLCYHCQSCTNGCPFLAAMDYPPNAVIRMVQLGLRQEVLNCATIWTCVGCHTCSIQCPMAIDMAAVMDVLRQMALDQGVAIPEPDVYRFHQEVLHSIRRYGRTHKLEIMLRFKLHTRDFLGDLDVGLKMLAHRKLDLMPSKVSQMKPIRPLFAKNNGKNGGEK